MRDAHPIERAVGIDHYVSESDGIGGKLRASPEDFVVRELEAFDTRPVDADTGPYPHLVIRATLHDWETNDFAGTLSDGLGVSRERISWAGTKDKRAVTTQLFSIDGVDPADLPDVSNAELQVIGRAGRPVLFGDLAGNEFEITVTDVAHAGRVDDVTADLRRFAGVDDGTDGGKIDGLGEIGEFGGTGGTTAVAVPNYFGQQRFGSRRPVTHEVGLAITRRDWEGAVLAYVGNPHEREPGATRAARAYAEETRDWQGTIDRLPHALGYERSICHRLVENGASDPGDFREALEVLPTNLQTLFVNAAQSFAFNRILSERLERGLPFDRPVAGDVVCFADDEAPDGLALADTDRLQRVTQRRVRTVERHCERGRAFVTAPLVGTESELADGEPGELERAILDEVGVEPDDFALPGEFESTGTRRAIQVRTDLRVEPNAADRVRFDFALPKGSYATVLLREYLKRDPE